MIGLLLAYPPTARLLHGAAWLLIALMLFSASAVVGSAFDTPAKPAEAVRRVAPAPINLYDRALHFCFDNWITVAGERCT